MLREIGSLFTHYQTETISEVCICVSENLQKMRKQKSRFLLPNVLVKTIKIFVQPQIQMCVSYNLCHHLIFVEDGYVKDISLLYQKSNLRRHRML